LCITDELEERDYSNRGTQGINTRQRSAVETNSQDMPTSTGNSLSNECGGGGGGGVRICGGGGAPPPPPPGSSEDSSDNKKKKARTTFTGRQIFELEKQFEQKKYLSLNERAKVCLSTFCVFYL